MFFVTFTLNSILIFNLRRFRFRLALRGIRADTRIEKHSAMLHRACLSSLAVLIPHHKNCRDIVAIIVLHVLPTGARQLNQLRETLGRTFNHRCCFKNDVSVNVFQLYLQRRKQNGRQNDETKRNMTRCDEGDQQ